MSRCIPPKNEHINALDPSHPAGQRKTGAGVEAEEQMSDEHPKRDSMSIGEATNSKIWEIAVIVEILDQAVIRARKKGTCG